MKIFTNNKKVYTVVKDENYKITVDALTSGYSMTYNLSDNGQEMKINLEKSKNSHETSTIKILSNPARKFINFELSKEDIRLELYIIAGKVIFSEIDNNTESEVKVSNLKNGTYMVQLCEKDGSEQFKVLIDYQQ